MPSRKALLFSAPSGSGKTTIIRELLKRFDCFEFAISATSRKPRPGERDGVDYYYLTPDEFRRKVSQGAFLEYEEVYEGMFYGTLKSEVDRIWDNGHTIIFDVDVKGGLNIKRYFGDNALSIFVMPPSMEVLRQRLVGRGTESGAVLQQRLDRSEAELALASRFDITIVNDDLATAVEEASAAITQFLR